MIQPQPFRRPSLDCDRSWCDRSAVILALACHKGNASQEQTSTQTGAQTGGAVATGTGNANGAGNQIVIQQPDKGGWSIFGSPASPAGPTKVEATINNGISGQDVTDFVNQFASVIQSVTSPQASTPAPASGTDTAAPANPAVNVPLKLIIGGVLVVLALVIGLVVILKPKNA